LSKKVKGFGVKINSVHEKVSMFRAKLAKQTAKDLYGRKRDGLNFDVILGHYHDNVDKL
jgi:hypothetical protein